MGQKKKKSGFLKKLCWFILIVILLGGVGVGYIFLTMPEVEPLKHENPKTTALIEQRKNEAREEGKTLTIRQKWVSESAVPQMLKNTVLTAEDSAFYQHEGIDYYELKESIKLNIKNMQKGKKTSMRGASTITQQLAKNLYLSTERSVFRKMKEFFIAKQLERHLTKDRILALYLNVIEFGRGIFGVEAASQYYFGKSASRLNLSEIVRLTAIIPKPLKEKPTVFSRYVKRRGRLLLVRLRGQGYISDAQYHSVYPQFRR
ncbi:MAG: transglycosylase domain-containing protein [Candidatus Omnitrophota bacterium]